MNLGKKKLLNVNSGSDPNICYIWELLAKLMINVISIFMILSTTNIYNLKIENDTIKKFS